jgi:hypothetical protein
MILPRPKILTQYSAIALIQTVSRFKNPDLINGWNKNILGTVICCLFCILKNYVFWFRKRIRIWGWWLEEDPDLKGIVSWDLMRITRSADGFIGYKINPRYNRIGFIFHFKVAFVFKYLTNNLYAQPASHVGALAGRGRQQELLIGKPVPRSIALAGSRGPQELLSGKLMSGSMLWRDIGDRKSC